MKNPFIYGKIVGKEHFADRVRELNLLKNAIISGQNVIIYSPRRYGKSSLVYNAIEELKGSIIPIWIDCFGLISKKEFAEKIATKTLQNWKTKHVIETIKKLFKNIKPKIVFSEDIEVEFSYEDGGKAFEEALNLPQKLSESLDKRVVVVFDEFQEVARLGEDVLPKMRGILQRHNDVCYIFIGSKMGMMENIFKNAKSPFYNFGTHIVLKRIPKDDFKDFIIKKFENTGIKIENKHINKILNLTKCHPYYTQKFCHRLWFNAFIEDKKVTDTLIEKTLEELLIDSNESYIEIWDSLTLSQQKVLIALAKRKEDLYSTEFLVEYEFKSPATVQSALQSLKKKELIVKIDDKYTIEDPFFEMWILRKKV